MKEDTTKLATTNNSKQIESFLKVSKDHVVLNTSNQFRDTVDIESNEPWQFVGETVKQQVFDKFGNELFDGALIELGEVSANMVHIASLFFLNTPCMVQLNTKSLKFFDVVDDVMQWNANQSKDVEEFDTTLPIAFVPTQIGEYSMSVQLRFFDMTVWSITITATAINVDERLKVMMSNFYHEYLQIFNDAMLLNDNRQEVISNIMQNEKMREFVIRRDDIDSKLGTYTGLLNALDWLGYTNSLTVYEVLKNKIGQKQLVELGESIAKWSKTFFRTNLLTLVYAWNFASDIYCDKCKDMPIMQLNDTLPDQDIVKKLTNLVQVLEHDFLPEHIHIDDIQIDVFVPYIALIAWSFGFAQVINKRPSLAGYKFTIKDVNSYIDESVDAVTSIAWVRPHTLKVDKDATVNPLKSLLPVFVVQEHHVDLANADAASFVNEFIVNFMSDAQNDSQTLTTF